MIRKLLSLLLIFTIFLSVIYIPTYSASVVLPDGTTMTSGESSSSNSGYTAIGTAAAFKKIAPGGKYYLTANIDLTASGVDFTPLAGGSNSATNFILDGCGYTITTNKPLFEELPGNSGTEGSHSQIRNLVIKGNIAVTYSEIEAYSNGYSVGALVGKANGGRFTNIVNNANVTVSGTTNVNIRVGGIVGSIFNDSAVFTNCVNNGNVTAPAGASDNIYGVGGIIGYIANSATAYKTTLKYCENTGDIKNTSTVTSNIYAGGIFGNKRDACTITMANCSNTGNISANVYYGQGVYQGLYGKSTFSGITTDITPISNATEFQKIVSGGKYYLTSNIDLTASGVNFASLAGGANSASVIILDGCGHTVKTNKPIFKELPGGGVGKHSVISNLNIEGNISLTAAEASSYSNTIGALVGKANGGIFKNITNNATVTVSEASVARVAGIVGSVFNEYATFENCVNNGDVTANVTSSDGKHTVAGIVAYIGVSGVSFTECSNTAKITNVSDSLTGVYAGGIFGTKVSSATTVTIRDSYNSGKVRAKTAYGSYYAISTYQNVNIIKVIPIASAEDFAKIKGNNEYKLVANITLNESNANEFSGVIYGNGFTVTSNDVLFKNDKGAKLYDVNVNIISLNINGRPLNSFAVVASSDTDASAKAIVDFVKSNYDIELSIKTPSDNYVGNAIYINLGNTYGGARYGLDYGVNDKGYMEVYLDETSANISTYVSNFLKNKLTTTKDSYDFFNDFGQKSFRYELGSVANQGFTFNQSQDVVRTLASGVTYIQRTYTSSNGTKVKAYITVMEAGAAAHVEVQAAPLTKVSSCENDYSANCLNLHGLSPKSTSDFVAEMEDDGKNVLMAMNAGFFMKSAGCYAPWGMQIINGRVDTEPRDDTSNTKKYSNWFAITKDGKPVIGDLATYNSTYKGNILYGVGARDILLRNDKYLTPSGAHDARTAVGYNANGDIVMFTVPGNDESETNPGATLADLAQIFMDLDMDITSAMSLDGGGSTTMVVEAANGKPQLESPLYSTTSERALGNILAIVSDKK